MKSHNEENVMEEEERQVYGGHQEYDSDGNYQESCFAMSATKESAQDWVDYDDQEDETYAS
jgi:hypothetical protein